MEDIEESSCRSVYDTVLGTIGWVLLLTFLIQFCVRSIVDIALILSRIEIDIITFELRYANPIILSITIFFSTVISIPILKYASNQSKENFPWKLFAFKKIQSSTLVIIVLLSVVYYFIEVWFRITFDVTLPQIMLDIKLQSSTTTDFVLILIFVGVVAPFIEEVVFRGFAYARIQRSKLGSLGAVWITSILFTILHYQLLVSSLLLFLLIVSFLLGFIRYRTNNVVYCFILHSLINSYSTVELFFVS